MIDLNTATAQDLDSVLASNGHAFDIVHYREERGRFSSLRQLDEVSESQWQGGRHRGSGHGWATLRRAEHREDW
ncbi:hypothetical protein DK389_26775 [Methylobacterium durans]|uniref:Uncharacterized protein n=2 Tax=Methylobacterium durans TaxID=2202825 RepID=A0A2U8WHJ8_9HYPH|nr:helix-hairpin-helix domain-containing protein [Methylobacterium durans]AWN44806.1 hypothetical protein DK389_26775 [Methylobacterium durans]